MQIAVNRTMRKLKQVSISAIIAGFAFLVLLIMLGYWGYITLQASRITSQIEQKQQEFQTKNAELTEVEQHPGYLKLLAAKHLETQTKTINWEQSLRYLTSLLEELKAYNNQQKSVDLANFSIDSNKITLQGTVGGIKDAYAEGGIIDRFTSYPFVKYFKLPYFRQNEAGGYEFILDADIYHYDGIEPTS